MALPDKIFTWQTADVGSNPENPPAELLQVAVLPVPEPGPGQVLVEIAGCSLCQRDLGAARDKDDRETLSNPLQIPAHDIAGRVVAGEAAWIGREVLVPALAPGRHHGLSSHVPVSTRDLIEIENRKAFPPLAHLSVAVDVLAVPFQAAARAGVVPGDRVIVLGLGGEGPFLVQLARALGAGPVAVVDTCEARLNRMRKYGADLVARAEADSPEGYAAGMDAIGNTTGVDGSGWKVFITSGCGWRRKGVSGLANRADRLSFAGPGAIGREEAGEKLSTVGADIVETGGCPPENYPLFVEWIVTGRIALSPFLLTRPMSWAKQVLAAAHDTTSDRRIVLTPDDFGIENALEARSCR